MFPTFADHICGWGSRNWEAASETKVSYTVRGKLIKHVSFWRDELNAPGFVLDMIEWL